MTEVVYLHVGGPKSGTTFVQHVLETNAEVLASAGTLVVGPRLDAIHAAMVIREDRRVEGLPDSARGAWQRIVARVREWSGPAAIVSYELFAGATAEQARRALAELGGLEVHVVITARDLGKSIPSAWQEQLKFGLTKPLERWSPPKESAEGSEWGWRTMQPANVAARWGADLPPSSVHVVTVPASASDSGELWRRFAEACGLDSVAGLDLSQDRANESLGVVEAELLRRVNKALDGRVEGSRQRSLWIRDVLAHQVLAALGSEPIGLTEEHLAEAASEAEAAAEAIRAAGYRVHGDLDDLRPRGSRGRLPSDVEDREVLESAVLAMADQLVWARGAGADPSVRAGGRAAARTVGSRGRLGSARGLVRSALRKVAAPVHDRRVERLERRIAELESQVKESRQLHLRVATLSDLVEELLLPAAQRDEELTMAALRDYRKGSL